MDQPRNDLRRIREELARLYPHVATIRRVATDAGLAIDRVDLSGPADVVWFNVLEEAGRRGLVEAILDVAQRDYPNAALGAKRPRELYGEPIWQSESSRVYALAADAPWALPVEALTLPSAPGSVVRGDLVDALFTQLSEASAGRLRWVLQRALQSDPLSATQPRLVALEGDGIDGVVPRTLFLACANTPEDAEHGAALICAAACERGMTSVVIPMIGSGRGGLNSTAVALSIFRAVRRCGERGAAPEVVVLTTRDASALDALHAEANRADEPLDLREGSTPTPSNGAEGGPPRLDPLPPRYDFRLHKEAPRSAERPTPPPPPKHTALWLTVGDDLASWGYPDEAPLWSRALGAPWRGHALADPNRLHALALDASEDDVRAYGDALSDALFGAPPPAEVVDALRTMGGDHPLRVVFNLSAAAACIPWEYLRVDGVFLLNRNVSLVRHVASNAVPRRLTGAAPLGRVVLAVAAPFDAYAPSASDEFYFDTEGHRAELEDGLYKARVEAVRGVSQCSERKLSDALSAASGRLDALHFLGHGRRLADPPTLVVHDHTDPAAPADLTGQRLAELLAPTSARFIFLGACHSGGAVSDDPFAGVAHAIVRATGIPVVAMQLAVPQRFSTTFAADFYAALAAHEGDLEVAVACARRAACDGRQAFGIPALFADVKSAPAPAPLPPAPSAWGFASLRVTVDPKAVADAIRELVPGVTEAVLSTIVACAKPLPHPPPVGSPPEVVAARVERIYREAGGADEALLSNSLAALRPRRDPPSAPLTLKTTAHVIEAHDERSLRADWARLDLAFEDIARRYVLPKSLLARIASELLAERHVLLVGPVGTGKTSLALELTAALGYAPLIATASADWSAHDVVGGFWPEPGDGGARFTFRPGVFTEAVLDNWSERTVKGDRAHWDRRPEGGRWLILDELNRADMDRAMGAVFTALETRRLRVPMGDARGTSVEVPVPKDFRVFATINGADRHHLFRLSDALRRRFAFVEVPDTLAFAREREVVEGRLVEARAVASSLIDDVLRFVRLARAVHPVGTAQVIAAARFLHASEGSCLVERERVSQALLGAVVPTLETAGPEVARLLGLWARGGAADALTTQLRDGRWRSNRIAAVGRALDDTIAAGDAEAALAVVASLALPSGTSYPEVAARLEALADESA